MLRKLTIAVIIAMIAVFAYGATRHVHTTSHTHSIDSPVFQFRQDNEWITLNDDDSKADSDALIYRYNDDGHQIGMSLTYGEFRSIVDNYTGTDKKHIHRHRHDHNTTTHNFVIPQESADGYMQTVWNSCDLIVLLEDVYGDVTDGYFTDIHKLDEVVMYHTNVHTGEYTFKTDKTTFRGRLTNKSITDGTFADELRDNMVDWLLVSSTMDHIGQTDADVSSHTFRYLGNDRQFARKNRWRVLSE